MMNLGLGEHGEGIVYFLFSKEIDMRKWMCFVLLVVSLISTACGQAVSTTIVIEDTPESAVVAPTATTAPPAVVEPTAAPVEAPMFARDQPLRFDVGPMTVAITGTVVSGQRDRYAVSLISGELLHVNLTALEANAAFSIIKPDQTVLPGTEEGGDTTSGYWTVYEDGEYAIIVGPTRGNASYTLNVKTQDPVYAPSPDCAAIGAAAEKAVGVKFTQSNAAFHDGGQSSGIGCVLTASATGAQWDNPQVPIDLLIPTLSDWVNEGEIAGGPTGMVFGFFKGDQWLQVSSDWQPAADANCPQDQPISACDLKPEQKLYTLGLTAAQGVWGNMVYKPIRRDDCRQLSQELMAVVPAGFTLSYAAPFLDYASGETGLGCALTIQGTGAELGDLGSLSTRLSSAFPEWTVNQTYAADGPTGFAIAFNRAQALLMLNVQWVPAPGVTCPDDQPIALCNIQPEQMLYTIELHAAQK